MNLTKYSITEEDEELMYIYDAIPEEQEELEIDQEKYTPHYFNRFISKYLHKYTVGKFNQYLGKTKEKNYIYYGEIPVHFFIDLEILEESDDFDSLEDFNLYVLNIYNIEEKNDKIFYDVYK